MEQKLKLTSEEVSERLTQLCDIQCSGIVFMMTEKNIMLQIVLTEGDIVSVVYQTKRGIEALELIRSFESVYFTLFNFISRDSSANKPKADPDLPPTSNILGIIKRAGQSTNQTEDLTFINIEVPTGIAKGAEETRGENTDNLTQLIEIVVTELTLYLGPIAPMLCEEHLSNARELSDVLTALDKIASVIDDNASKAQFKRQVIQKIENIS